MRKINKINLLICLILVCMPVLGNAGITETSDGRRLTPVYTIMGEWGWGEEPVESGYFKIKANNNSFNGAVDIIDGELQYNITGVFNSTSFKGVLYIDGEPEDIYGKFKIEENKIYGVWFWRRGYGWFNGYIQ